MSDSIEVSLQKGFFHQTVEVRVRSRHGLVYLKVGDKVLPMQTPAAHRLGMAMVTKGGEAQPGELVIVKINGEGLQFPPSNAKQVGGALLRKADDADDFQQQRTG